MSAAAKITEVANDTPVELIELQNAIEALPVAARVSLMGPFQRVLDSTNRRRKILTLVQEALGQLRLDMKYLVFDLEATRRERDLYREQLRDRGFGATESDSDDSE